MNAAATSPAALAQLQRAARARTEADRLRELLPDPPTTAEDFRAYAVWHSTKERFWDAHKDAMSIIFDDSLDDDAEATEAARRRDVDALGVRIKAFVDFCREEVEPRLTRLEGALTKLQAVQPSDARFVPWWAFYGVLRTEVREALPVAWSLIFPAAKLHRQMPEEVQLEANRRWGPLTGTDPADFGPVWKRHFPTERLQALDRRAKTLQERP